MEEERRSDYMRTREDYPNWLESLGLPLTDDAVKIVTLHGTILQAKSKMSISREVVYLESNPEFSLVLTEDGKCY